MTSSLMRSTLKLPRVSLYLHFMNCYAVMYIHRMNLHIKKNRISLQQSVLMSMTDEYLPNLSNGGDKACQ